MRETGTTTSSLIFFGAMWRSAGERALRARHRASTSAASSARRSSTRPSTLAAAATAASASSMQAAGPSTSIIRRAPVPSGTSIPAKPRTMAMAEASMNSRAQGVTGWAMRLETAAAAAWMSR